MGEGVSEIAVTLPDGRSGRVDRVQYVRAKAKQLREFGYDNLTEADVDEQIDALLAGKPLGGGLTVIGMFMKGEVAVVTQ